MTTQSEQIAALHNATVAKPVDMHAAAREAGSSFNRGNGALRAFMARAKADVGYHTGQDATPEQVAKLVEYRTDICIGAVADHLAKGGKANAALLAEATAIVTSRSGFRKDQKDTDNMRTDAQHKVVRRTTEAWRVISGELDLPKLDSRGGSNKGQGVPKTEAEANGENPKAKVASFGFTKTTAPAVFAEGLAALCTRYIAEQGTALTGDYAAIIRHFVENVTRLRTPEAKAA